MTPIRAKEANTHTKKRSRGLDMIAMTFDRAVEIFSMCACVIVGIG